MTGIAPTPMPRAQLPYAQSTLIPIPPLDSPDLNTAPHIVLGLVGQTDSLNPLTGLNAPLVQLSPLLYQPLYEIDPISGRSLASFQYLGDQAEPGYRFLGATYEARTSLQAAQWPEFASLQSIDIAPNQALTITLTHHDCLALDTLAQLPVLTQFGDTTGENPIWPRGDGPYQIQAWPDGGRLYLIPNETDQASERPDIIVRFFDQQAAAEKAANEGTVDILPTTNLAASIPEGYQRLAYQSAQLTFVTFNNHHDILDEPVVRQALSLAVQREHILQEAYQGEGILATSILPPYHWAANPNLSPPAYDPEKAKRLLDEMNIIDTDGDGWRNIPQSAQNWQLSLRVREDDLPLRDVAFLLAHDYRQIGIHARVEMLPLFLLLDRLLSYDYEAIVYAWSVRPELDLMTRWHSDFSESNVQIGLQLGLNISGYANKEMDTWLEEVNQIPGCDHFSRAKLAHQVQAQLALDRPFDFLVYPHHYLLIREDIQGLELGPFLPFTWHSKKWQLK